MHGNAASRILTHNYAVVFLSPLISRRLSALSTFTPANPECLLRSKGSLGAVLHTEAQHLLVSGQPLLPALEDLPPQRAALLPTPTPAWFWQPQAPHAWLRLTQPCPLSLYTTHTPPELEGPPRPNHTFKLSHLCRSFARCLQPSSSSHTCLTETQLDPWHLFSLAATFLLFWLRIWALRHGRGNEVTVLGPSAAGRISPSLHTPGQHPAPRESAQLTPVILCTLTLPEHSSIHCPLG